MTKKEFKRIDKTKLTKSDWCGISLYLPLTQKEIRQFADYLEWGNILCNINIKLSENFIREFSNKFNDFHWRKILQLQNLSEKFLLQICRGNSWMLACKQYRKLSQKTIERFKEHINWTDISKYQDLSEQFIEKYKSKLEWGLIAQNQKLSEPFIKKYGTILSRQYVSRYQKLSQSFIRELQDFLVWTEVFKHQRMSKQFMREFANKIDDKNKFEIVNKKTKNEKFLKQISFIGDKL